MLYISPLFKLDKLEKSFEYADDVAILEISPTLETNSERIGKTINQALAWGRLEGLTIDPEKSKLLHFSRKHRDKIVSPPIVTNDFTITMNQKIPYLKWLGIYFDKILNFKQHACIQALKALKVANALRSIGNIVRGLSPQLSRQVVNACVLPIAHFGSTTWWPGKTMNKDDRIICNRVGKHLKILDKVHKKAARVILPVYRTTPTAILFRETGLSPAELVLDNLS